MPTAARKAALQPAQPPPDPQAAATPPAEDTRKAAPEPVVVVPVPLGVMVGTAHGSLLSYPGSDKGWAIEDGFLTVQNGDDNPVAEFAPGFWGHVEYIWPDEDD